MLRSSILMAAGAAWCVMKKLFRLCLALSPSLSLAVPLVLFGSLMALSRLSPALFCMPMNPGGKEFICGRRYSHIGIQLLQQTGLAGWVLLLVASGPAIVWRRAARPAVIAWSVSALMLCSLVMLLMSLPRNECP